MTQQVTPSMQAHAQALLARSRKWARGVRTRDGLAFVTFTSSRMNAHGLPIYYYSSERGCTCPGHRNRGICAHVVAIRMEAEQAREAVGPKPRTTLEALMDKHLTSAF